MKTSIKVSLKILSLGVKLYKPASRRGCFVLFSKVNSTVPQMIPTANDPETANDPQNGPQMILDRK